MKICGIACVMDSHEILKASITHLVLNGIVDFYLYDHGSTPDLMSVLSSEFGSDAARFRILRKDTRPFFQRAMVAALTELARLDGFEIAVAFDVDEFWCSTMEGNDLADQVSVELSAGVDAVRVPVVNYVQHAQVDAFHAESLLTCGYSLSPSTDDARRPQDQVNAGVPFVAVPFPSKVISRLADDIRFIEGQHDIVKTITAAKTVDASGIVVRHLPLPGRDRLVVQREHGRRRISAGYAPDIGWQAQRLAHMTDAELDAYWKNNSWHLSDDGRVLVGTYDRLVQDDALVQIGRHLAGERGRFRGVREAGPDDTPLVNISSWKLERLVQSLVDDFGMADRAVSEAVSELDECLRELNKCKERRAGIERELEERTTWSLELNERLRDRDERLTALTKEFKERTAWAVQLSDELAQRERELVGIKSSALWRTARALRLAPRPRTPGRQ